MGSGSLGFALAGVPALATLDVGSLIQQPAVLLGAAAIVVVAVLIVLIMVLRGGSKRGEMAEMEDDQQPWDSSQQVAVGQQGRGYDAREQMLPWEQGGARAEGPRQQAGGKRGAMTRDPQAGWGQPDDYGDQDGRWGGPAQAMPRGGQWGADQWAQNEAPSGRGGDQRLPQGQMAPRDQESWAWGAGQSPAGAQGGGDQWGQDAGAGFSMGRDGDQWGQRKPPMGREADQWGQRPGGSPAMGREADQWGQAAPPAAMGGDSHQWGQPTPSSSMGWDNNQWGQGEQDQWGQAPARGRAQDQWGGQPSPAMERGMDQPEDQGAGMRGGPRWGADAGSQMEGQRKQGGWGQEPPSWEGSSQADRWNQGAQSPQASWSAQPAASSAMGGMTGQPQSAGEWGERRNPDRPGQGGAQPGNAWGVREPAAWQADPRQEPPSWEAPGQRNPSSPRPQWEEVQGQRSPSSPRSQWEQVGRAGAESAWESGGADEWGSPAQGARADEWGLPAQGPKPSASRPVEPASPRGVSHPPAASSDWGERDFERPTAKPGQPSGGWEQREMPAWQATPEPPPPARQPSGPQMAASASPVEAPMERRAPEARQVPKGSPDDTAYGPPASGGDGEGEATKTVVMRKDAAPGRVPSVVVRQGKEPGRTYEMRKEQIKIGRSRESDIFLEDLAVSRLHATIYRDEMGAYQLRDENSANGTSVNGQRISECTLQEGDEIQLGQTILAFVRR